MTKTCFVTVGSTRFDALIDAVLSEEALKELGSLGFDQVILQYGAGDAMDSRRSDASDEGVFFAEGLTVNYFRYQPSIDTFMCSSDLIIGHAGAGTCLEALRYRKPMIAVINDKLMDNHQSELAERLHELGHLVCSTPSKLVQDLRSEKLFNPEPLKTAPRGTFAKAFLRGLGFGSVYRVPGL